MGVSQSELAEPVQGTSRLGGRPPGLLNEGNTCFMNAAMQAMSACPPFIKFLYQLLSLNAELLSSDAALYSIDHAADESGATLVFQLAHLLSLLAYPSQAAQDRPLRLTSIVNTEHMVSMVNGEQQDAHEALFSTLMCVISEQQQRNFSSHLAHSLSCSAQSLDSLYAAAAASESADPPGNSPAASDAATSSDAASVASSAVFPPYILSQSTARRRARAIVRRRGAWGVHPAPPPLSTPTTLQTRLDTTKAAGAAACVADIPSNPLTGWMLRRTKCVSCDSGREWSCEPFVCLSVSPPWTPGVVPTLSACLRNYFSTERIPDWRCEACGGRGCVKACRMARRPPLLALHVQAPGGARVVFPDSLDVGADCGMDSHAAEAHGASAGVPSADRSYSLVSVVQHVGVDGAGHYIAYRREPHVVQPSGGDSSSASGWLCADDARMLAVPQERVMGARPYLLLYMSNSCLQDGAAASVQLQVAQWEQLHGVFELLVAAPDGEGAQPPAPGGAKGGVAHSKADHLLDLRQQLGLQAGKSGGLVTICIAGASAPEASAPGTRA